MSYPDRPGHLGQYRQSPVARHAADPDRDRSAGGNPPSLPFPADPPPPPAPSVPAQRPPGYGPRHAPVDTAGPVAGDDRWDRGWGYEPRPTIPGTVAHPPSPGAPPSPRPEAALGSRPAGSEPWPLIADDLFWLAHDDTARLVVDAELLGLGLACALLTELAWDRRIGVEDDLLIITDRQPPRNGLAHEILEQICTEPAPVAVQDWLRYLAPDAFARVARRLVRAGHLEETVRRRLLRRPATLYEPTDANTAYWPFARLNNGIETGRELSEQDRVLVGVCLAIGAHSHVLNRTPDNLIEQLRYDAFATRRPIPQLLRHLETVAATAISIR